MLVQYSNLARETQLKVYPKSVSSGCRNYICGLWIIYYLINEGASNQSLVHTWAHCEARLSRACITQVERLKTTAYYGFLPTADLY